MLALVIDTATAAVTAGVVDVDDAEVRALAVHAPHDARGHGELLAPGVRRALADAGAAPADLTAVVAGLGPGPFTGLRVGLVTAAVFGETLGVPVHGVCSLDGIGGALPEADRLLVATDARRREVYWARYRRGVRIEGPAVCRPADVPLDGVTDVAGPGAELYAQSWPDLPRHPLFPDVVAMAATVADRIRAGEPGEPLVPLYLRRPDAAVPGTPKPVSPEATR